MKWEECNFVREAGRNRDNTVTYYTCGIACTNASALRCSKDNCLLIKIMNK